MSSQRILRALRTFALDARSDRRANPRHGEDEAGLEQLLTPRFITLLKALLAETHQPPTRVLYDRAKAGIGRPDLALVNEGGLARSFIELKAPGVPLDPSRFTGHNKAQFQRFLNLPLWALCNFEHIHLYRHGELEAEAIVLPAEALAPGTKDQRANRLVRNHESAGLLRILLLLASASPPEPEHAVEAAEVLGYAASLVREVVAARSAEGFGEAVANLREDFTDILFSKPQAGGYDDSDVDLLFASAFAQTLVFGLLLAREAGGKPVDAGAWRLLPDANYPLLRGTLRALTLDEVQGMLGTAFDVAVEAVNSINPETLAPQGDRDPVLYLYEDFLRVFDPDAVKRYGVFYTPPEVVNYMVAEVDRTLRQNLAPGGLLDGDVRLLDPACGTGTFLLAATRLAAERATEMHGQGLVAALVDEFADRSIGFELLVGPYTVAHYRVLREVLRWGGSADRMRIYLTDTLAPASEASGIQPHMAFLSAPMVDERTAADRVKQEAEVLVVMGNPPYKRLRNPEVKQLVGNTMDDLWQDLKDPVRKAGMGRSLNAFPDLYVAFYRWAMWKLFEAPRAGQRGILAFITNRKFLTGNAFGGLRRMLRQRFDHIRIIDFRGDLRGARPVFVPRDENIFDIQVGVCVLVAEARGQAADDSETAEAAEATVEYADVWRQGIFERVAKLDAASRAATEPDTMEFQAVRRRDMAPLVPRGFDSADWPSLDQIFTRRFNGIVTYRDRFAYAKTRKRLARRIRRWLRAPLTDEARDEFHETRDRPDAEAAHARTFDEEAIREVTYRPLDRRFLYNEREFVDRPRLDGLQAVWGEANCALHALNDGTGGGPAVWCHGAVPDQHAFNNRGGWIFPRHDRSGQECRPCLNADLVATLSTAWNGASATPARIFDAVLALLSATSYTSRFGWDLERCFPHVPFPASPDTFDRAAALGRRIRELETFASEPAACYRSARIEGDSELGHLLIPSGSQAFEERPETGGTIVLRENPSKLLTHVSRRAWEFQVSGYPVLQRWLAARSGERLDAALGMAVLDTVARIEELVALFDQADELLDQAADDPICAGAILRNRTDPP